MSSGRSTVHSSDLDSFSDSVESDPIRSHRGCVLDREDLLPNLLRTHPRSNLFPVDQDRVVVCVHCIVYGRKVWG